MRRRRLVRVPASSANLGPGYDSLAAAIGLYLELEVTETGGELEVLSAVEGVPLDRSNMCVRAFEALHPADGLTFRIDSEIPLAAGLGSSAACVVAGLCAADHMYELDEPILEHATRIEGHPDNAAAALHGGFVICADGQATRFDAPDGLEGVLVTPPGEIRTEDARAALPAEVPLADAVHNAAHAALLVLGLARGDLGLVAGGLSDRLHQSRRAHLYPRSIELIERAQEVGALGATVSGAGPTVLFWSHYEQTGALYEKLRAEAPDCDVRLARFTPEGADVTSL